MLAMTVLPICAEPASVTTRHGSSGESAPRIGATCGNRSTLNGPGNGLSRSLKTMLSFAHFDIVDLRRRLEHARGCFQRQALGVRDLDAHWLGRCLSSHS